MADFAQDEVLDLLGCQMLRAVLNPFRTDLCKCL